MISRPKLILLIALAAFAPLTTDIYLSSMPVIARLFQATESQVQLTLSVFFVAYAVSQLIWGPLSDRFGRKPMLIIGLFIYSLSSLICALSSNIETLIIFRLLQAVGGASGIVIVLAMIHDIFRGRDATSVIGVITSVRGIAPIVAPIIGSALLSLFAWQANFIFLFVYSLLLIFIIFFIAETRPVSLHAVSSLDLLKSYVSLLKNRSFIFLAIGISFVFASMFAFIASSSFIYIQGFHLSYLQFSGMFAFNATALFVSSQLTAYCSRHQWLTKQRLFLIGLILVTAGAWMLFCSQLYLPNQLWWVALPIFVSTFGVGIVLPAGMSMALDRFGQYAGVASGLLGSCYYIFAAPVAYLMGHLSHTSALALAVVMVVCDFMSLISLFA